MMSIIVRVLIITVLLGEKLHVTGLEFLLNNISIPTDGSGRILVTDIKFKVPEVLICRSEAPIAGHIDWYVDPEDESATSIADADKIGGNDFRGWVTKRIVMKSERYQRVTLKRVSDTAVEGRFTCSIPKDSDSPRGLLFLHPINSVTTSIEMISDGNEAFRVRCTSTGGRVLNMSVTGPDFNSELSNIQAVGNQTWMSNDSYTATTGNITGSSEKHEVYYCTASNGVSSLTDCLVIKASISDPKGVMAENVLNPLSVRVSWQAVKYANRYTVTFTKAMESLQEGPCKSYFHTVTLSVDTASVNVSVGQDVGPSNTTMLRAYTTYLISVVAESDVLGTSDGCDHIILTTPQSKATPKVVFDSAQSSTLTLSVRGLTKCRYLNGLIDRYRVQYSTKPNGTVQTQNTSIQHTDSVLEHNQPPKITVMLTGLTPYTAYSIQVAEVSMQGDVGPYSDIIVAQTAEATPGPVVITAFPSFFKITIIWPEPSIPNGIIAHYEVYYGRHHFKPSVMNTTTGLDTSFTTPGRLEPGTELFFTVTAYTRVGGGEPVTVIVSTLNRP